MAHKRVINSDAKHTEYVIIKNIHSEIFKHVGYTDFKVVS